MISGVYSEKTGMVYFDRGDIADHDKTLATLTADGNWHTWDLSGIVSSGTKLVKIKGYCKANLAAKEIIFRKNGNSNSVNIAGVATQVANVLIDFELHVAPDANGVIEYQISSATWAYINLAVAYWFV